ncbi:glutathione ABC transporter substrate-binding protein [Mesobaculum littorinae]|uniref:Glutathione-binding protein GsiB n=1 Tax=Mesobaculum littorinae TaxID=2486419 RepID=A0A438AKP4_9RHOB|nr:glutathione ABC transporter substrate-binding protein [Mesobaculum littorinae]RVV99176.1 glutathione ABC transporter substrate-binding protein [Mesobaculum littorinae]
MAYLKTTALAAVLAATGGLAQAQDIKVAMDQVFHTLDPQDSNYNVDFSSMEGVFERLISFDEDMGLVPQLATEWEANEDATQFTLTLREGVVFHDGTPFNAEAVKANLERLADQSQNLAKNSMFNMVDSVEAPDETTVVINLKEPFGAMINTLAHPAVVMHSPASLEEGDVSDNPVGTGPFRFDEWVPGEQLRVVANEDYWDSEWPKVDSVTFYPVPENATRVSMLLSDEVQFVYVLPAELAENVESNDNYEVLSREGLTVWTAAMNMNKEHFQDPKVREAFNLVVDQEAFLQVVYSGHGSVPDSPIAPNTQFHEAQEPALSTDVERARELMEEAGYGDGFEVEIWARNNSTEVRMLQFLKQQLSQINVDATVLPLEGATRSERLFGSNVNPETIEYDLAIGGWSPSTGDADWHLRPVYATEGFIPAMYNMAFYSNEVVDGAVAEALATADPEARAAAYAKAQEQIWADQPAIFLAVDEKMAGRKKGVTGVIKMPDGTMQYSHAAVEE